MTKEELKQLSNANYPDNNVGFTTPAKAREFNNALIDSLSQPVDYAIETEQLTGEIYAGKSVYTKMYTGSLPAGGNQVIFPNMGFAQDYWIDASNSFIKSGNIVYGFFYKTVVTVNLLDNEIEIDNGENLLSIIYFVRIKYTKQND